jgi:hypothetical protein
VVLRLDMWDTWPGLHSAGRVGAWEDIPVSDWVSRRLGDRLPRLLHVVSSGARVPESDSDSENDTPRSTYPMNEDLVDTLDATASLTEDALHVLEEWVQEKQQLLMISRAAAKGTVFGGRRTSDPVVALSLGDVGDSVLDMETAERLKRMEAVMGPRLRRSHGVQLAWLVGNLRPGTWHSFRVLAENAVGEGPMCEPTGFLRTFGTSY